MYILKAIAESQVVSVTSLKASGDVQIEAGLTLFQSMC